MNNYTKQSSNKRGRVASYSSLKLLTYYDLNSEMQLPSAEEKKGCLKSFSHTKKKSYICEVEGCIKTFTNRNNLKRHKRVHTGFYNLHTQPI